MNHRDALHILGLNANKIWQTEREQDIKIAYRRASSKYHPDRNQAGLEMMKLVNEAYESLQDYIKSGNFDNSVKNEKDDTENYGDEINEALNAIINLGLTIEICGSWVWVSGDTKTHREVLKEAGYKWAPKKLMWHFSPKGHKSFNRGKWDMGKIRDIHGSTTVKPRSYLKIENI